MNRHIFTFLLIASGIAPIAMAEISLPAILAPGMVVQRGEPVHLWGKAEPGESVRAVCGKAKANAIADSSGRWSLQLPALKPGGPYTIKINDTVLDNVLAGDVFVCSGQSNMELPVSRVTDMFADEIEAYSNPEIRQFSVDKKFDFHASTDEAAGHWNNLDPETAMSFSALGYFFAKRLNEATGIPVAIVNSSWGGTPIEAWISLENLKDYPLAISDYEIYKDDSYRDHIKALEGENFARWNATLYAGDPGLHEALKWYESDYDDSAWQAVDLPGDYGYSRSSWGNDGINPVNGSHWFRKDIEIPSEMAGKEATVRLGCIVDADSVFFNGRFIGTTGYQYPPRIYHVPGELVKAGKNQITVRLISQNGVPEFVAEKPYKLISGDSELSLEGKWKYRRGATMPHGPGMEFWCYKPTVLYNAMISPLAQMPVAGVVWYQGESNVARRNEYDSLLRTLMSDWRSAWADPDMPFYIVELADFLHESNHGGRAAWAEMRAQQAKAVAESENAVLIKNSDLGEWNDIHPLDKKTLGNRVAEAVLASGIKCKSKKHK